MTDDESKKVVITRKKLASMGPDTVIIIPRIYIKNKILDPTKLYNVTLEEVTDEE